MGENGQVPGFLSDNQFGMEAFVAAAQEIQVQNEDGRQLNDWTNEGKVTMPELIDMASRRLNAQQKEAFGRLLLEGAQLPFEAIAERQEAAYMAIDTADTELTMLNNGESEASTARRAEVELLAEIVPELREDMLGVIAEAAKREVAARRAELEAERQTAAELRDYLAKFLLWPIPDVLSAEERAAVLDEARSKGAAREAPDEIAPEEERDNLPVASAQDALPTTAVERATSDMYALLRQEKVEQKMNITDTLIWAVTQYPMRHFSYRELAQVMYGSGGKDEVGKLKAILSHIVHGRHGTGEAIAERHLKLERDDNGVVAVRDGVVAP